MVPRNIYRQFLDLSLQLSVFRPKILTDQSIQTMDYDAEKEPILYPILFKLMYKQGASFHNT